MRKILTTIVFLGMLTTAGTASASSILLNPATVSVTEGQTFTVAINVYPVGTKLYTVKSVVNYPSNMLEVTAFTFTAGTPMWIPLSQPGYDSMTPGSVTKTAGFPGGFIDVKTFGTITFRAKESGTATISVSTTSLAYDAQSKNTITGTQGTAVVTVTPTPAAPPPTPRTTSVSAPSVSGTVVTPTSSEATSTTAASSDFSQVAAVATSSVQPWWLALGGLLGGLVATALWWLWNRKTLKS